MKPIEPEELSAFLDGELSSARTGEVEAALKRDPVLRAQFSALAKMDAAWRSAAETSVFAPKVRFAREATVVWPWLGIVGILFVLVAVRILPKLTDGLEFGFILHGVGLVIALAWVVRNSRSWEAHYPQPSTGFDGVP